MKHVFDPNDYQGTDSRRIQAAVDAAAGGGEVVIPKVNRRTGTDLWEIDETIELPSNSRVVIDGAHLRMADGVFCQMFRNKNAFSEIGKTPEGEQHDIAIVGRGGALLDGGKHNGLRQDTTCRDGMPDVCNNLTIYLHNVRDFEVSGLTVRDQRWWAIACVHACCGVIRDLRFELTERLVRGDKTQRWRNQDGVDLRIGCHDILVENMRGETGDDIVAMTALAVPGRASSFDYHSRCPHLPTDIHDITVRGVEGFTNHCTLVRILCHNGHKIYNIRVEDITDATPDDHPHEVQASQRTACCVKIGECGYQMKSEDDRYVCRLGELRDITVRNVRSSALTAIAMNCAVQNIDVRDITVGEQGSYAVAVAKITAGVFSGLDKENVVTNAENVLVENVRSVSKQGTPPFLFAGLRAKDFTIRTVRCPETERLADVYRPQAGGEPVRFEDAEMTRP